MRVIGVIDLKAATAVHAVAITMTAELSDAFRTKREGVAFVLDAAQDALGARPLRVLTTAGDLGGDVAEHRGQRCAVAPDLEGTRDRAQRFPVEPGGLGVRAADVEC